MKNYPVSFIMPYRMTTEDRERNLKLMLEWLGESFLNYEIIIVELDGVTKIDKSLLTNNVKHVFHKHEGLFNRSLARNVGALNATHKILAFSDNDVIINPEEFNECVSLCQEKYQAVNPYFVCIDLTEKELASMENKAQLYAPSQSLKAEEIDSHREDLNFAGGMLLIRKDAFFYIGGWPEEMKGWGAEDDVLAYKIDRFLTKKSFKNFIYHLPHERTVYDWYDHPEFKNNCDKMNKVFELTDQALVKYCEEGKNQMLESSLNDLTQEEKNRYANYQLPQPRKIDTLEAARREDDSIVAYPLILD